MLPAWQQTADRLKFATSIMELSAAKVLKLFSPAVVRDINGVKESGFQSE